MSWFTEFLHKLFPSKAPPVTAPPSPPKQDSPKLKDLLKGIDVARYQVGMDWKAVASDGNAFVIIKATDGESGTDPCYVNFRKAAKDHGLVVGSYCFGRFWADPIKQADHFLAVTGGVLSGELPLALDVEWDNAEATKSRFGGKYADGGEIDEWAADHAFKCLSRIEQATGIAPMIYTAPGFFTLAKNAERFMRFPLWINDFHAKEVSAIRVPKPWQRPHFWQFAEKPLYGVTGVDMNYFLGSQEELKALVKT
jgi:lysozyme